MMAIEVISLCMMVMIAEYAVFGIASAFIFEDIELAMIFMAAVNAIVITAMVVEILVGGLV